jgi:hypothetical protein
VIDQTIINWVFVTSGALGGWVLKFFYDRLHDLSIQDQALSEKVQAIELLVAGEYVKRDQLERMEEALFRKLDKIEDLLSKKADK